ncbi:MAG: hypothetical protein ACTTKD_06560 [Peptoanaerobacter stomatis]|uniref:hypothetical protein n=1 Tax=Peptoanaerobacter stomatis TaxID=796937 RepID=UPI003FA1444F
MKQEKGSVFIYGQNDLYDEKLESIKQKEIFDITRADYSIFFYEMQQEDRYSFNVNIGEYYGGHDTFTYSYSIKEYKIASEINEIYKRRGIDGIKPYEVGTGYSKGKSIKFEILAKCNVLPTITNLKNTGNADIQDITVSWNSTNQDKYTITATVNEEIKYTSSGTNATTHVIPKNTFVVGDKVKIFIKTEYSNNNKLTTNATASEEISMNITDIRPTLIELKAINNTLSWKGNNLSEATAKVELYNIDLNNIKVADIEIPQADFKESKYIIPPAIKLYNANHLVRLTVSKSIQEVVYNSSLDAYMQVSNRPYVKINSLEPCDVMKNYEKDIIITWDTINQQTYNIKVYQNNILKFKKSGTSEKTLTLPKNTLKEAIATIHLTVTNTIYNIVKQDIKTVSFSLYGGLKPPNITTNAVNNVLDKNNIIISWNKTDLQRYYRVEFEVIRLYNLQKLDTNLKMDSGYHFDGDYLTLKEDSGIIRSNNTQYTSKNILFNCDNIKNIKVTVYDELKQSSSAVYGTDIYVNYDIVANTIVSSYVVDDKIIINSKADMQNVTFKLMRGTDKRYTTYKEVFNTTQSSFVYEDENVKSDTRYYYYVITTVDNKSNASNVVTEQIRIKGFLFTNLETNNTINLNLEVSADFTTTDGKVVVEFLGKPTADIEQDERNYQICNYSCLVHKDDIVEVYNLFDTEKVSYRDRKGNAFICNLTNKKVAYSDNLDDYIRLSFDMIEIDSAKQFE